VGRRGTYSVIRWRYLAVAGKLKFEFTDKSGDDTSKLNGCELLADTPMSPGAEGEVWAGSSLADKAEAIVELLGVLLRLEGVPTVRVKLAGVLEVLLIHRGSSGGGENVVAGGDDVVRVANVHGRLDLADDGVDRGVHAEDFADDVVQDGHLGNILVDERARVGAANRLLFTVEFRDDLGFVGKVKKEPHSGCHRGVLSGHQEGNHHVCDFLVGDGGSILVAAVHQVPDHILFLAGHDGVFAPLLNQVHVEASHLPLRGITTLVAGEREPRKQEVHRIEAEIEIVKERCERSVESVANLFALQRTRSSEDSDLRNNLAERNGALRTLEVLGLLEVVLHLLNDQRSVSLEGVDSQSEFHELCNCQPGARGINTSAVATNLLLLHKTVVGTIIDDTLSENGSCQVGVDLLGVDFRELSVEHKVVALRTKADGHLHSEQYKRKHITVLSSPSLVNHFVPANPTSVGVTYTFSWFA